jgi:hypothetical protein
VEQRREPMGKNRVMRPAALDELAKDGEVHIHGDRSPKALRLERKVFTLPTIFLTEPDYYLDLVCE